MLHPSISLARSVATFAPSSTRASSRSPVKSRWSNTTGPFSGLSQTGLLARYQLRSRLNYMFPWMRPSG